MEAVVVDPLQLPSWQQQVADDWPAGTAAEDGAEASASAALFPVDCAVNSKLVLWPGDLLSLKVGAIVCVAKDGAGSSGCSLSERILQHGGPALRRDVAALREAKEYRTGEARLTEGHQLCARYVLHTVGPRYNARYRTAAESALYNSTRAVLELVLEHSVRSVAMAPVHSASRGYPPEDGAHLTLRCLRRFLERHGDSVDRIVVGTASAQDADCYRQLARVYFPRNAAELRRSKLAMIGREPGGLLGEPVHHDRTIRISAHPAASCLRRHSREEQEEKEQWEQEQEEAEAATATGGVCVSSAGSHAFARMEQSPDSERCRRQAAPTEGFGDIRADAAEAKSRRYDRFLRRARAADLADLRSARCLFHSGVDAAGRPLVVVVANSLPAAPDYSRLGLLALSVIHQLADRPFSLLYVHTAAGYGRLPPRSTLKQLRDIVDGDPRWRANLAVLLHLHADARTRLYWWWFAKFNAPSLPMRFCACLQQLFRYVSPDQLDLPDVVYDVDRKVAVEVASSPSEPVVQGVDAGQLEADNEQL